MEGAHEYNPEYQQDHKNHSLGIFDHTCSFNAFEHIPIQGDDELL